MNSTKCLLKQSRKKTLNGFVNHSKEVLTQMPSILGGWPLHFAAAVGSEKCVRLLLEKPEILEHVDYPLSAARMI